MFNLSALSKCNYVYILKWVNEKEKYVRFDSRNNRYKKVIIADAQVFDCEKDAEKFVLVMKKADLEEPEIIAVDVRYVA